MAKVIPIGQPANESERQAIGFLRDHLPDGWLIFHNFEMRQGEEVFEIDIAILAPHAVYLKTMATIIRESNLGLI